MNVELINNLNDWNKWIEEAISKKLIRYFEFKDFSNVQEIGSGGFAKIQLQCQVDYHINVIHFYGVTSFIKEHADNGTFRNYLKENYKNLNWNNKYKLAFQLVHAVSCLHDEGIIHRDLHSNNVLVHQHDVKLSDFGLSKRIEETSNSQSKTFGLIPYTDPKCFNESIKPPYLLNKKSDIYSIGVLLWKISSGRPPFHDRIPHGVCLAINILQGLRETPIHETPENHKKLHTDCWNIEPDNRLTINQVVDELKAIITKENIIIKDSHLYDDKKDNQSSSIHQLNSDAEISEDNYSFHGNSSQVIDFTKSEEIESSISSYNQIENNYDIIVKDIINFIENNGSEVERQEVLNYFNNQNIAVQDINNLLLKSHNSDYIFLFGKFNYLGIGTDVNKRKAFELYQKAAKLGNANGI
ncbi:kinase-like domain-containing protein [Rhizophagus clarus]|uniref:Kinase-like domain-containing protein n=1 Tax=Rhizophagus clarus TaxID=94130 RepID=A0A8H3LWK5_9GLOM|nr:kinase-like domain-containing protein [Rhizophagus clarus]